MVPVFRTTLNCALAIIQAMIEVPSGGFHELQVAAIVIWKNCIGEV